MSHDIAAWLALFAYIAGITSTLGVLISAVNSQARLIFNAGREGLLPRWLGKVHPTRRTPVNAIFAFVAIAAVIIVVWALLHLIGGDSGSMSALNFFVESSTMGTILVLVVYFLSNLALPFYYRKYRPQEFNIVKHAVLPVLGMIAIAVPVYYLVKPGQAAPYDWFPYAALGVIVVSVVYAVFAEPPRPGARRPGRLDHRRRVAAGGRRAAAPHPFRTSVPHLSKEETADDREPASARPGHRRRVPRRARDHGGRRAARGPGPVRLLRARGAAEGRRARRARARPTGGCAPSCST